MSKQYDRLMAAVDAAGYVLAAPEEDVPPSTNPHLEAKFRNGHRQAALKATIKASQAATVAAAKAATSRALTTTKPTATSWLHVAFVTLRPKRLAA